MEAKSQAEAREKAAEATWQTEREQLKAEAASVGRRAKQAETGRARLQEKVAGLEELLEAREAQIRKLQEKLAADQSAAHAPEAPAAPASKLKMPPVRVHEAGTSSSSGQVSQRRDAQASQRGSSARVAKESQRSARYDKHTVRSVMQAWKERDAAADDSFRASTSALGRHTAAAPRRGQREKSYVRSSSVKST